MEMWCLIYLGPPDNPRHDQGRQFVSPRLQFMAAEAGVACRPVGVESPNAMSLRERYTAPLRKSSWSSKALTESNLCLLRGNLRARKDQDDQKKLPRSTSAQLMSWQVPLIDICDVGQFNDGTRRNLSHSSSLWSHNKTSPIRFHS